MPNARKIVPLLALTILGGCSGGADNQAQDQNIMVEGNGQLDPTADIETLPADESSATPSSELQNGFVADEEQNAAAENGQ